MWLATLRKKNDGQSEFKFVVKRLLLELLKQGLGRCAEDVMNLVHLVKLVVAREKGA